MAEDIRTIAPKTGKRRRPTIVDVAALAGVSPTTAARTFSQTALVTKETRRKVLVAAGDVGYVPSLLAKGLRGAGTHTIGLLVWSLAGRYSYVNSKVLEAIRQTGETCGYRMLISAHDNRPNKEKDCAIALLSHGVDGFIVFPAERSDGEFLNNLLGDQIPIVTIDSHFDLPVCDVSVDREHGAYLEVKHLLDIGRRKLAFLVPRSSRLGWSVDARIRGYRRACLEYGIDFDEQWRPDESPEDGWGTKIYYFVGMMLTRKLLGCGVEFDAVVAPDDQVAFGATMALLETGRRIPDDVALVGFDNEPLAEHWIVPLTTVHQPTDVGQVAANVLLKMMGTERGYLKESHDSGRKIVLKPHLVVRESTVKAQSATVSQLLIRR